MNPQMIFQICKLKKITTEIKEHKLLDGLFLLITIISFIVTVYTKYKLNYIYI